MAIYCNSPWTSIFLEPNGDVRSCCAGNWNYGNINDKPIEKILAHPKVALLKQELLDGKIPQYCKGCEYTEEKTGTSQRAYFDKFDLEDTDITKYDLQSLDIRWSNLCNLACNYCDHMYSSEWQKLKGIPITSTKQPYHESLLTYINNNKQKITSIILAGGEPLMQKQNISLLESLDNSVRIELITNLSFKLEGTRVYELIKQRKNVIWSISFDNLGEKYNYTRHKADWNQFNENFQLIKRDRNKVHPLVCFPVFSIYSIPTLKEYMQFAREHGCYVHWQPLSDPKNFNIFQFSKPVREYAQAKIKEVLDSDITLMGNQRNFFEQAYENLNNDPDTEQDVMFRIWTDNHEKNQRTDGLKFSQVWPELDAIIKHE